MSDIFDDVEKMVAAEENSEVVEASTSENTAEEAQIFNESELEDIMAEIESLESDFDVDVAAVVDDEAVATQSEELRLDSSKVAKTDLQKEIEREIEKELENVAKDMEVSKENVLNFETTKSPIIISDNTMAKSEMSFQANGKMNVVLNFAVGDETATLVIDETRGLVVNMSGVELCLNQTTGCTVTMVNGVNFNIPLTTPESSSKKKAA
jgi:frataxin-like iron-binding protein CyaY